MAVGEVKQSEKNIIAEYGVASFPTLLVISPEHGVVKFEGKLSRDSLKSFMEKYALPPIDKDAKYKTPPAKKATAPKKAPVVKKSK